MATKKYISFSNLTSFLDNLKTLFATKTEMSSKANASHSHTIADVSSLQTALNGKAASSHGTHVSYSSTVPVMDGTASIGSASTVARSDHKHPTDTSRAAQTDLDALETVVAGKAASSHSHSISNVTNLQSTLDGKAASGHSHSSATTSISGFMTASDKSKLDGITASADSVSFSRNLTSGTKIGTITINGTGTDLYAPTNTDTHYTSKNVVGATNATSNTSSALTNGNVYINSVENGAVTSSHKISGSGATTVTTDANGNIVISSTDNNTTYSAAGSALGLVKSGGDVTISSGIITVNDDSHNHTIANVDNLQASLDAKQATVTGGASTITSANLTSSRALVSDSSGKVAVSDVTSTELGYLDGVTSNVQTQLDGKASSTHNHGLLHTNFTKQLDNTTTDSGWSMINDTYNGFILKSLRTQANAPSWAQGNYAAGIAFGGADTKGVITQAYGSPSITFAGGNSDKPVWWIKTTGTSGTTYDLNNMPKAQRLNTNAGDSNTPVYFSNGIPVACTSLDLNTTGSAAKLTTARTIGLGNDLTGSATFDGSGNVTISAKHYNTTVNSSNKSNYPYHRIAYRGSKASPVTSQYNDTDAIFLIRKKYYNGSYGILKVSLRTNSSTAVSSASATWLVRYNIELDDVKVGLCNVAGATYADIYLKVGTYARTVVSQLEGDRSWTLVSSNEVSDTTTSDPLTSTECYTSIETAATTLHGQAYSSIISSVDGGQVATATKLGSSTVGSAAKPIYLNSGTPTACSSTVGSATQPVYMNGGTVTACTYTLGKSVPSNAVFTDTNTKVTNTLATTTKAYVTGTTSASTNTGTQVFDTGVYLDTTAGQLTATTFNGSTFKGSGVATVSEVETYLGI